MTDLEFVKNAAVEVLGQLGPGYKRGVYEVALAPWLHLRQVAHQRRRNFELLH